MQIVKCISRIACRRYRRTCIKCSKKRKEQALVKTSSEMHLRVFLHGPDPSRGNGKIRLWKRKELCISFHGSCAFTFFF